MKIGKHEKNHFDETSISENNIKETQTSDYESDYESELLHALQDEEEQIHYNEEGIEIFEKFTKKGDKKTYQNIQETEKKQKKTENKQKRKIYTAEDFGW